MAEQITTYVCNDDNPKNHKLTYDGGSFGNYILKVCDSCYPKEPKKFLLKDELIE